jgi:hypothetical protein
MVIGTLLNLWTGMKKNNDLRAEADNLNYYFGEVKLWYDANKHRKYVGVVVESKANELLFRKLLHRHCCFFAVEGRKNVEAVLSQVNRFLIKGTIGIIDADFSRLLNQSNTTGNLFLTDYHDTELMCILSPAWENVLDFYIQKEKFVSFVEKNGVDFRTYLLQICKPIGVLRLLNEQEKLELKFKTRKKDNSYDFIDYEAFIDKKTLQVDVSKLFKAVENKSSKLNFFANNPSIITTYNTRLANDFDLKQLNNGHDMLNILSVALQEAIGNRKSSTKISGATLEDDLVKGYRIEDFTQTILYQQLLNWQTNDNPPFKIVV